MRTDTSIIGMPIDAPPGTSVMHFGIVQMPLLDGTFSFALGIQSRSGILYDWQENAGTFEVMNPGKTTGSLRMDVHAAAHLDRERLSTASAALAQPAERARTMSDTDERCRKIPRPTSRRSWRRSPRRSGCGGPPATCPPKLERELDELFLAHSPVAGRGGDLGDALRMVDAATFIDPVVPVESERAAGAVVKKGMRSLLLWYVGWLTHQMSQSASAVSRALHIVDDRLQELRAPGGGPAGARPPASSSSRPSTDADAWWVEPAVAAVAKAPGRILHAACGDGWLVRRIVAAGGDAYGVDPRARVVDAAELAGRSTCAASPWARTSGPWPRPAWVPSCSAARSRAWPAAERSPAAGGHRDPPGPRRDARGPLGDPAGLGVGGRATRGRPRRRPAAAARGLVQPAGAERVRGRGARSGPGGDDFLVTAVRAAITSPYAPAER